RLSNVEFIHLHTMGPARYADAEFGDRYRVANLFVGPNLRSRVDMDHVDYLPCFLSEIPALFRSGKRPIDVAMLSLSPPDSHGCCALGTSVDVARAAVEHSRILIAQINRAMPRVHGDGFVHINDLDAYIEVDDPIPESELRPATPDEQAIGHHVASLVEDGS